MGYTAHTVDKLEKIIAEYKPKSVMDLGAQNMYNQPILPAPYASEWYKSQAIKYISIDLNGENGSYKIDLSKNTIQQFLEYEKENRIEVGFDLLVDAGTSEHIADEKSKFSWEAIYNCWVTKHELLKVGGIMYNENPKTGNWPLHGRNYYTQEFYIELAIRTDYEILDIGEHFACNNFVDGCNVFCTLKKNSERFLTLEEFKDLSLMQS